MQDVAHEKDQHAAADGYAACEEKDAISYLFFTSHRLEVS